MIGHTHHVEQHRSAIAGIDAMSLCSNHSFPRHWHDQLGIGIMTSGAQRSWSGIGQVESQAGDVIMASPGEMHDGVPIDGAARRWHMLYFEPALVAREITEETPSTPEIARPVVSDPHLARLVTRLFVEAVAPSPDRLALEEGVLRALMWILRRHTIARPAAGRAAPAVSKARARLDAAPEMPVSLAELAALSGVSRFQLLRGFAHALGITPHAYVVQRRVLLARRLLAAGERPAEVALRAGFADQSHLTRAFVRRFGITPGRYQAACS